MNRRRIGIFRLIGHSDAFRCRFQRRHFELRFLSEGDGGRSWREFQRRISLIDDEGQHAEAIIAFSRQLTIIFTDSLQGDLTCAGINVVCIRHRKVCVLRQRCVT